MKLSYFPQVQVVHTSKTFHGQLYIPLLNWLLMIGTVLIAAIYNNTTSLGNAYGVCVMFVTFFDTCMVSLVALIVWRIHPAIVFFPWLAISCLDGLYLSSALTKVPDGAWFTLTLATVLACLFILWRFGKEQQWAAEASDRFPTTHLVQNTKSGICLTPQFGGASISTVKGFGIFFDKAGETTPAVFTHFLSKLVAAPEVMVFFHLRPLEVPSVAPENRYHVSRLAIPNCYRLIVRHGFMDAVITPDLASLVLEQVRDFVIRQNVVMQKGPEEAVPSRGRAGWHSSAPMLLEAQTMENENEKDECEERAEKVEDRDDGGDAENTLTRTGTSFSTVTDPKQRLSNEAPRTPQKTITWDTRTAHPRSAQLPIGVDTDPSPSPDTTSPSDQKLIAELHHLSAAFAHQVLYIVGKEEMRVMATPKEAGWKKRVKGWWKRGLLEAFLWMRDNTRTRVASLGLPTERVVEVGFVKEVGGV
jgi:KUP system potassium uptake protein